MQVIDRRRVKKTVYEVVPVEVLHQVAVPKWMARQACDLCGVDFESKDEVVAALHIYGQGTGDVLFSHIKCSRDAVRSV